MENSNDELTSLVSRISGLERQNRWLKLGALLFVAIAGVAVMVGAAPTKKLSQKSCWQNCEQKLDHSAAANG